MSVEVTTPDRKPDVTRKFQCTYLGGNNNKWWQIELWEAESVTRTTFGRVGETCSKPSVKVGGRKEFNSLIRSKTNPKNKPESLYTEIELHVPAVVNADNSTIDSRIQARINKIFNSANESIYTKLSGTVDALSLTQIQKGRGLLAQIRAAKSFADTVPVVQSYYNTIPTQLGRNIDQQWVVSQLVRGIDEEDDRLNQLEAALQSHKILMNGGNLFDQLGSRLDFVTADDEREIGGIFKRNYREAWKVEIPHAKKAFENETKGSTHIRLLIHGTKSFYVRHILRQSLILPNHSGLFGAGIYFADDWNKSYGYTGGDERPFFLVDVKLGKMYITPEEQSWRIMPEYLGDSCFGEAAKQIRGVWAGSLRYNEYIVYKPTQVNIRYLIYI